MPVIQALPQAIKMGANFVPQSAEGVGRVQALAQAVITIPSLRPVGPALIPMPVFGIAISMLMTKIKVIPAEMTQRTVKIISNMQAQYAKDVASATTKRKQAQTKLFSDLSAKKAEIVQKVKTLEDEIAALEKAIKELSAKKEVEMAKYQATIIEYAATAKQFEAEGRLAEAQIYKDKISALDYWLAEIVLMMTDIINKKLELKMKQVEVELYQELIKIEIENDWEKMTDIATDFSVAIPYYPDMPGMPNYPRIPKFPEIPAKARTYMQMFNKWLVCPLIPPTGVMIAALLAMIKEKAPNNCITAAKLDSKMEAIIPKLGGMV